MPTLPPSHFSTHLTDERLSIIADRLLDVRYDTLDTLSTNLDDNYTRETAAYGRQRNMLIRLALSNQYSWLNLLHAGMDITFSIGTIPCRFFTDDPLHPNKDGFFKRNATDNLFATDDNKPVTWRFIVAKSRMESEDETVYFVGYNMFNEKLCEWVYTTTPKVLHSVSTHLPPSIELPPAQPKLLDDEQTVDKIIITEDT